MDIDVHYGRTSNAPASHNVPLLGDEAGRDFEQRVAGTAGVIAHASRPGEARCVLDLSEVYGAPVERLRRGVQLRDGRSRVLVQDEWRLAEPRPLAFGLTTRAEVELGDGRRATLRLGGRALRAEVLEPERASFVVEDCPTGAGERSNEGFRRLVLRVPAGRRSVRIAVLLTPVVDGAEAGGLPRIEPLAHW